MQSLPEVNTVTAQTLLLVCIQNGMVSMMTPGVIYTCTYNIIMFSLCAYVYTCRFAFNCGSTESIAGIYTSVIYMQEQAYMYMYHE